MQFVEIERKWLLDAFPDLPLIFSAEMEQGYLAFYPNTVRIRKTKHSDGCDYELTVKGPGKLKRAEVEAPLTADEFSALEQIIIAPMVCKDYREYQLPSGEKLFCNWVDKETPQNFYYAEVEFETTAEAKAFIAPPFLGEEVTDKSGHSMACYAKSKIK